MSEKSIPWNKGLTKETDSRIAHTAEIKKGIKRTPEQIKRIILGSLKGKAKAPFIIKSCKKCGKDFRIKKCSPQSFCHRFKCSTERRLENKRKFSQAFTLRRVGELGYISKNCIECGLKFKPRTSRQLTCDSGNCRKILQNKLGNAGMKRFYKEHKHEPERICKKLIYTILHRIIEHKNFRSFKYMAFTQEEFIKDISSKFLLGMTWENHGKWHLDHKRPLCLFKFVNSDGSQNIKAIKKANALSNLQPLWAIDNLRKNKNYVRKI